jgi:hypothetical protein
MRKYHYYYYYYKHGEGVGACQKVLGDFEIENLADNFNACLKAEKQRWLVSESKENIRDIPISKVRLIILFTLIDVNNFFFSSIGLSCQFSLWFV